MSDIRELYQEEAERLIERFQGMVTSDHEPAQGDVEGLGKTRILAGVRDYPARVKCATLAWHTLSAALHGRKEHEE
jgi:nitrogen fixation NifU-like protein